jgi:putative FmdB family regulatory protein
MPLYEYYCAECRTKFEALRPMNKADAAIQCKSCESMRTSRVLSLFAAPNKADNTAQAFSRNIGTGGGCCGGMCGCGH